MERKKKESIKKPQKKREAMERQGQPNWLCMLKGMAVAYGITCIFFIVYGILLTYTEITESSLPIVALVSTAVSAAVAGYDWATCRKRDGLITGAIAGFTYCMLLFLVTGIAGNGLTMEMSKLITLVVALAGGGIGGILGVNRKGKK